MNLQPEQIRPRGNFLIIDPYTAPTESRSGLVIPEEKYTPTPVLGKVIMAGPKSEFKPGQFVLFRRYSIDELKFKTDNGSKIVSLISDDEVVAEVAEGVEIEGTAFNAHA